MDIINQWKWWQGASNYYVFQKSMKRSYQIVMLGGVIRVEQNMHPYHIHEPPSFLFVY